MSVKEAQDQDKHQHDGEKSRSISRRDFVARVGGGLCFGGITLALAGVIRTVAPSVYPEPSQTFRIGLENDIPMDGFREFDDEKVFVFRDEEGLYAISSVCTHLGCIVTHTEEGFQCPCHGSRFDGVGRVVKGPAPKSLLWFEVRQTPGGQLVVDRGRPVEPGSKFTFGEQNG